MLFSLRHLHAPKSSHSRSSHSRVVLKTFHLHQPPDLLTLLSVPLPNIPPYFVFCSFFFFFKSSGMRVTLEFCFFTFLRGFFFRNSLHHVVFCSFEFLKVVKNSRHTLLFSARICIYVKARARSLCWPFMLCKTARYSSAGAREEGHLCLTSPALVASPLTCTALCPP